MVKISILHPSRSRPGLAKQVYNKWMGNADDKDNIEYLFSLDESDPQLVTYIDIIKNSFTYANTDYVIDMNNSAIEAINNAAKESKGELIIVVSDDFDCPEHWDTELLKHLDGKSDFCAKTQDGIQQWMMTMPIMDRVYYERYGFIYNPEYQHMYCDLELSCVADMTGKTVNVPMLFRHNHYTQKDGIKKDAVTIKNDSTYKDGERIFLERAKRNFDLPDEWIVSEIKPDANCYNWFVQKGVFK